MTARQLAEHATSWAVVASAIACMIGAFASLTGLDYPYPPGTGYVMAILAAASAAGNWALLAALQRRRPETGGGS